MNVSLSFGYSAIAILFGFVSCNRTGVKAADSQSMKGELRQIQLAVGMYRARTGRLPTVRSGLSALVERPDDLPSGILWEKLLQYLPLDPWNRPYHFVAGAAYPDGYGIYSTGPDGISQTRGNDADDLNSWTSR